MDGSEINTRVADWLKDLEEALLEESVQPINEELKSFKDRMWLGTYDTAEDAALAYDRAAIRLGSDSACLNFPKVGGFADDTGYSQVSSQSKKCSAQGKEQIRPTYTFQHYPYGKPDSEELVAVANTGVAKCATSCRDDRDSGLDKEIGERNAEEMQDNRLEELFRLNPPEFLKASYICGTEVKQGTENHDDLSGIVSGTRTDGDCSDNEAMSGVYGSKNSMQTSGISFNYALPSSLDVGQPGSDTQIGERNVEGRRDLMPDGLLEKFWIDWNWDPFEPFNFHPPTDEILGTKNRDDIDSIISGTNTDGNCSENEAISGVYENNSSMQRLANFDPADKWEKLIGDARGDDALASRHYGSVSGVFPAHQAGNWNMGALPQEQAEEETMISEKQEDTSQQLPHILQPLFKDVTEKNEQVLDMKKSTPHIDLHEEITAREMSQRTLDNFGDITHLDTIMDKIAEDLPIKCTEPWALTCEPKRSVKILKDKGSTVEINYSVTEMILKEVIQDRTHTLADQRVDELEQQLLSKSIEPPSLTPQPIRSVEILEDKGNAVKIHHSALQGTSEEIVKEHDVAVERDERIEILPADDFEYASSYEDVGHAIITASQPSGFQTMKSLPQQVNMETMVLENEGDTSPQLPCISQPCEDGTEQDEQVLDMEKSTLNINSHEGIARVDELQEVPPTISKESISQYFGSPLDEARKIFGASRTEFKKMCRDVGIKRWQYGKRKMGSNSSLKHKRRLNNEEPGRMIFPTDMLPVHNLPVVSHTSQVLSTVDIKAMHNDLIIRFELPELSGKSELEDNVIKRLHLARNSFSIKYEDDGGHWVSITCDEDVRYCMKMSRSWKKTTINMLVDTTSN